MRHTVIYSSVTWCETRTDNLESQNYELCIVTPAIIVSGLILIEDTLRPQIISIFYFFVICILLLLKTSQMCSKKNDLHNYSDL